MVTIYQTPDGTSTVSQSDRNLVHDAEHHHLHSGAAHSHVCWGAVIAGAVTAISLIILSTSFAYAAGIPGYVGTSYGFGTGLYAVLTGMLAFFIGGAVVSYFADRAEQRTGVLHGIMAWCLALPVMLLLSSGAFGMMHMYNAGILSRPPVDQVPDSRAAAWSAFIALFLSLISAAIGGAVGLMGRHYSHKLLG